MGIHTFSSVQSLSRVWLCSPVDCNMSGFRVHHQLLELAQTHVHRVGDAIQPSHPLSSPSPPTFNLSQHQGLFQWVNTLHQVAKVDTKYMNEKYLISSVIRAMREKKINLFQTPALRCWAQESLNCDLGLVPSLQLGLGLISIHNLKGSFQAWSLSGDAMEGASTVEGQDVLFLTPTSKAFFFLVTFLSGRLKNRCVPCVWDYLFRDWEMDWLAQHFSVESSRILCFVKDLKITVLTPGLVLELQFSILFFFLWPPASEIVSHYGACVYLHYSGCFVVLVMTLGEGALRHTIPSSVF